MAFRCEAAFEYFEPVEISYRDCDGNAAHAAELAAEQHIEPLFQMPEPVIVKVSYAGATKRFRVKARVICIAEEF